MKKNRCIVMVLVFVVLALSVLPSASQADWKKYEGAWFDIEYPGDFSVRPSMPSLSREGFDSAFFLAPDSSVEFYVFSPQWSGEPEDFSINAASETIVSMSKETLDDGEVSHFTVRAKDKRYWRSMEDTVVRVNGEEIGVRYAFGIKYTDEKSYQKYRPQYLKFKSSIRRYAD